MLQSLRPLRTQLQWQKRAVVLVVCLFSVRIVYFWFGETADVIIVVIGIVFVLRWEWIRFLFGLFPSALVSRTVKFLGKTMARNETSQGRTISS